MNGPRRRLYGLVFDKLLLLKFITVDIVTADMHIDIDIFSIINYMYQETYINI